MRRTVRINPEPVKWVCTNCGYIYDPQQGDPSHGVAPGLRFEELPVDWVCPLCYAGKTVFDRL